MPRASSRATRARDRLGWITGASPDDADAIADARRDLAAAKLEDHIERVVDSAPQLSDEQRCRLAALLRPAP